MSLTDLKWKNNQTPALNEDNLNAMTKGITDNSAIMQYVKDAGLDNRQTATAFGTIVNALDDNITSATADAGTVIKDGKIALADLKSLLEHITYTTSGNDVSIQIDGTDIPSADTYGNYVFNAYANDNTGNFSDGQTCDYFHITLKRGSGTWTSVTVGYGTSSFTIGSGGSSIDFFDNDSFDTVNIEVRRIRMDSGNNPNALVTVNGNNAKGYNFRQLSKIMQVGAVKKITVSAVGATISQKDILYALPGAQGVEDA